MHTDKDKNIDIQYKRIKHGYVRVTPTWWLRISLPRWKRFDTKLKQQLIAKGSQLLQKQRHRTRITRQTPTHIRIRWVLTPYETLPKDTDTYLRQLCYDQSLIRVDHYSTVLWYTYNTLRIKKLRSKRGSCSSQQNININLNLVHLPKKFLEYVVAHEVCHLQHKHHQKTFWHALEHLFPWAWTIQKELRMIDLID